MTTPLPSTPALTATQQKIEDLYQKNFGRSASFGTLGGADYWVDQVNNQGLSDSELDRILQASDEGVGYAADQVVRPGGVDPNMSMSANAAAGNTWANHFTDGGVFAPGADLSNTIWSGLGSGANSNSGTDDSASALNAIAANIGHTVPNLSGAYYNTGTTTTPPGTTPPGTTPPGTTPPGTTPPGTTPPGTTPPGTTPPTGLTAADLDAWWAGKNNSNSGGMDDFMRFMMLMSVMNRGGGGGGYGGSQYGYGGLNPGGVMQAYDPLASLQGMGTWFKDNFGSGGATTGTVNTGTT